MAIPSLPFRPRVTVSTIPKYIDKHVTILGEVTKITLNAKTVTIRLTDEDNIIVLLDKNSTTIEPNLLTEVSGKLVSRGQIEATSVKQFNAIATKNFNRKLYADACAVLDATQGYLSY